MTLIDALEDVTRTAAGTAFLAGHPDEEKIFEADRQENWGFWDLNNDRLLRALVAHLEN